MTPAVAGFSIQSDGCLRTASAPGRGTSIGFVLPVFETPAGSTPGGREAHHEVRCAVEE